MAGKRSKILEELDLSLQELELLVQKEKRTNDMIERHILEKELLLKELEKE